MDGIKKFKIIIVLLVVGVSCWFLNYSVIAGIRT